MNQFSKVFAFILLHTTTDCYLYAINKRITFDSMSNPLRYFCSDGKIGIGKYYHKLLTAISTGQIRFSDAFINNCCNG